jgi:hypothetical protein
MKSYNKMWKQTWMKSAWWSGKSSEKPMEKAISEGIEKKHSFFVCREKYSNDVSRTYRSYGSYKNSEVFATVLTELCPREDQMFHEIITGKSAEFYDFDLSREAWKKAKKEGDLGSLEDEFIKIRTDFAAEYNLENVAVKEDFLVSKASNDKKKSVHMVVRNGYHFTSCQEHKLFVNNLIKFAKVRHPNFPIECIDVQMYNKNKTFRTLHSHKGFQEDRKMVRYGYNERSKMASTHLFLVSYIEPNSIEIELPFETIKKSSHVGSASSDEIKQALDMIKVWDVNGYYTNVYESGDFINLDTSTRVPWFSERSRLHS